MKQLPETLSRYLADDLEPSERADLEHRLETEPDVAALLERMRRMVDALDVLPPPGSPPAVVLRTRPSRAFGWMALAAAGWLFAAVSWSPEATPVPLRPLQTFDITGTARLTVEPEASGGRTSVQEDSMHIPTAALSALAGVGLTIAVYEGSALLTNQDGTTETIAPGEVRRGLLPMPPPRVRPESKRVGHLPAPGEVADLEARVQALQTENDMLRNAVADASTEVDLLNGFEPVRWPDNVLPALEPAAFTAAVKDAISGLDGLVLLEVDCVEYPCMAYVDATDAQAMQVYLEHFARTMKTEGANLVLGHRTDSESGTQLGIGLTDPTSEMRVRRRVGERLTDFDAEQAAP